MDFSASSESYLPAYAALAEVERAVEGRLKRTLLSSRFADFELLLRYVPVVMPDDIKDRYPARSKAHVKQRILDCAPQLSYDVFVHGTFDEQVYEFVSGLRTASLLLPEFGLAADDLREFDNLLSAVADACVQSSSSS